MAQKHNSKFFKFFAEHDSFYIIIKSIVGAVINVVALGLGTNLLATQYNNFTSTWERVAFWLVAVVIVGLVTGLLWLFERQINKQKAILKEAQNNQKLDADKKDKLIRNAANYLSRENTSELEKKLNEIDNSTNTDSVFAKNICNCILNNIQNLVDLCYRSIEDFHKSKQSNLNENTLDDAFNLKVNFMTESYKYSYTRNNQQHKSITIAAWKNTNNIQPRGLSLLKSQRDYFIYGDPSKISETDKGESEAYKIYKSFSENKDLSIVINPEGQGIIRQEEDIKDFNSAVVMPIQTSCSKLIGVLVIHCNKGGLFKSEEKEFFSKLLGIFAMGIRKEKLLLDVFVNKFHLEESMF